MYVWVNSVDSDQTALKEQSDQDLHCLPFFLLLLEALLHCKIKLFYIKDNYGSWSGCPNIRVFTVLPFSALDTMDKFRQDWQSELLI